MAIGGEIKKAIDEKVSDIEAEAGKLKCAASASSSILALGGRRESFYDAEETWIEKVG